VSDCNARLFKTELESLFNLKDESGVEIFYNVAVTPCSGSPAMCRASGRQEGIAPRYFRGVGHPGEVLIPGSEEIAIKGITNTRQSLKNSVIRSSNSR
jgi:hypothetical protein